MQSLPQDVTEVHGSQLLPLVPGLQDRAQDCPPPGLMAGNEVPLQW
jgi:hypothetical protein